MGAGDSSIALFGGSDQVMMPSIMSGEVSDDQKKLIKDSGALAAIKSETVKKILIPEESQIDCPNYLLDFTNVKNITIFQRKTLITLVRSNGTIPIYLKNGEKINKIGFGDEYELELTMPIIKRHIFGDELTIYRDIVPGEPLSEVRYTDITKLRLNL